jgi:hypothetical protein
MTTVVYGVLADFLCVLSATARLKLVQRLDSVFVRSTSGGG